MTEPIFKTEQGYNILERVYEGMKVFDANNDELGTIDHVYLGESTTDATNHGAVSATVTPVRDRADNILLTVQEVFGKEELPETLRNRLLQHGFVHVNVPGWLSHNCYVLPDQITRVTDEGIVLNATGAELIKE